MDLTFNAHLHVSTHLCPTFSLPKPGSIFDTLETVFELLVYCLPVVGLTEINPFLTYPPLVSLPLDFVSFEWPHHVWDPRRQVLLYPDYNTCFLRHS